MKFTSTFFLIITLLATVLRANTLQADNQAELVLKVVSVQDEQFANKLVIEVYATNISNLSGLDIQLQYNPAHLQVQDADPKDGIQISPGPFLSGLEQFTAANNVDAETGTINFATVILPPSSPVSGEGVLATITFNILEATNTTLEIITADLVSAELTPIAVSFEKLNISASQLSGGGIENNAESASFPLSKLMLWVIVGLLLLLLGGTVITLVFLRKPAEMADIAKQSNQQLHNTAKPKPNIAESSLLLTEQGQQALKRGAKQRAYTLFNRAIELDPSNTQAWLQKGLVAEDVSEKKICFERVLALDPSNQTAKQELRALR